MIADTIGVIVELYLGGILTQNLHIDLIPRVILRGAGIGKERGNHAIIFDCLHGSFVITIVIVLQRTVLCTSIVILTGTVLVNGQIQHAVVERSIVLCPAAVKGIAVCPAVRSFKQTGSTLTEICQYFRIGTGFIALGVVLAGSIVVFLHQLLPQHCQIEAVYRIVCLYICRLCLCFCERNFSQQILLQQYNIRSVDCLILIYIAGNDVIMSRCSCGAVHRQQAGQRRVPVDRDLIGGIAFPMVYIALCRRRICTVCLCSTVLQTGIDTADQHTFHCLILGHRRSVVRVFW